MSEENRPDWPDDYKPKSLTDKLIDVCSIGMDAFCQIEQLKQKLASQERVIADLKADKERLDWIDNHFLGSEFYLGLMGEVDVRQAIDAVIASGGGNG